jgi:hypothetical protein
MSILKTLYLFADWWLGWLFVIWPRVRRGDSVVIQRPWLDLIVDPKRYRLSVPPSMLRRLGRLLPDPSLTVLLQAPAEVIQARKTELSMSELEDQADRWRKEASLARRAKVVDASGDIDDVTSSILAGVNETSSRGGRHFSARAGNLILPRYPSKAVSEGLRLYHPMDRGTRAVLSAARVGAGLGMGRLGRETTPPGELRAIVKPWLTAGDTYAARRLRDGRRWLVVTVDSSGEPRHVLKIGLSDPDRGAIEAEEKTIRRVASVLQEPLAIPHLVDSPPGILAMKPVRWRPRPDIVRLPIPVADGLGALFKNVDGDPTVGRVHGDMAPWNLLDDGRHWVLIDWEASTDSGRPFHDLFHWVVQSHTLLSTPDSEEIVDGLLTLRGNLGAAIMAFASAAGLDPGMAPDEFGPYLSRSVPRWDPSESKLTRALARRRRLAETWRQAYPPAGK